MAKLILQFEGVVLREFELVPGRVRIGRRSETDLQLDDAAVSGLHAVLEVAPDRYFPGMQEVQLYDLDSTNGTFVNGLRVMQHRLQNGDVVRLGRHELLFRQAESDTFDETATSIILGDA